jgi:hypothetical protein
MQKLLSYLKRKSVYTIHLYLNLGIARQWIKSKIGNENGQKISQVFEDVDSDSVR